MVTEQKKRGFWLTLYVVLLALPAITLLVLGAYLVSLGGSAYYALAGATVALSAIWLWRGDRRASWAYAAMLLGTLGWTLWEAGSEPWVLIGRLTGPIILGLPLLWMWLGTARARAIGFGGLAVVVAVQFGVALASPVEAPEAFVASAAATGDDGEWPSFGRDLGGSRYAPFTEINTSNVGQLKVAWTYKAGSHIMESATLKIGDALYFCTARNEVISLDAETGAQRWRFDPKLRDVGLIGPFCRGVSYHAATDVADGTPCKARILAGTRDARLIALDARTGVPCRDFGTNGTVDLRENMGPDPLGYQYVPSPPLVAGDIAVVNTAIFDGQSIDEPSGVIRAFNVKTGALAWAWDMGRPGVNTAPEPGQHYTRGTPNSWAPMSADPKLGLVYVPMGNIIPDSFGAKRVPEYSKFASAVVALSLADGSVRWHYQTTHQDLWDYDIASQPVLTDFPTPAGPVPALIQATKRGELFVLDRRTGKPLTAIEERRVPQGAAPGDFVTPTQPYPVGFPTLAGPDFREADMWGLTPIDQLLCRITYKQSRDEGQFTPPSIQGTIQYPGTPGVSNWGSVSIDPRTGIMLAPANHVGSYMRLVPRSSPENAKYVALRPNGWPVWNPGEASPQHGSPYAIIKPRFMSALKIPCNKPPFGELVAIDLKTRKVLWKKPIGTTRKSGPMGVGIGLPLPMGVPSIAGVLVTGGNLSFFSGSQDGYVRALSTRTGKELWREALPAGSNATPTTYLAPKSGRQMLIVSAGGAVGTTEKGDTVIAYALPAR